MPARALGTRGARPHFTGSQISLYGLYNSTIITAECTLPPFFEKYLPRPIFLLILSPLGLICGRRYIFRRKPSAKDTGLRAFCLRGKGEEEPGVFYVLLNALLCGGLVWCPYQFLVEVTMLLMVIMTYPFLFAFVLLRISQPDVPRPFKVPGGTIAAVLWTLPPGLLGTAYLCQCTTQPPTKTESGTSKWCFPCGVQSPRLDGSRRWFSWVPVSST